MSVDSSIVVSESDLVVHICCDSTNLPNGEIFQYPDITPGRDEIVYDVIVKYLEDRGLSLNDVIVFYGKPADGKYSCMCHARRERTFGDDRFHYKQGDTMTIGLLQRTSMHPADELHIELCFLEEDQPHDHLFTKTYFCYCFELLQPMLEAALETLNVPIEDVIFTVRGKAIDGKTMTAHEVHTAARLAKGARICIMVQKYVRVLMRVICEDRSFKYTQTEPFRSKVCDVVVDATTLRGLTYDERITVSLNGEPFKLTDVTKRIGDNVHAPTLTITQLDRSELAALAVAAAVQAAGHKRALEAHEQRARILEAKAELDMDCHVHTVDFARRHYEDALRFQKRVNEINAMHVSDQAKLVADAAAALEKSERKRARFEAVLATIEEEPVAPAAAPRVETRVEIGACSVCFNERYLGDSIMLFVPCGHTVCVNCIPPVMALEVCPICRVEIRTTQAAFL